MSTTMIKGREVTRPSVTPLRSSVLDHATVGPDVAGFGWANNAGLWPSYNCLDTLVATSLCPDPLDAKPVKTFAFGSWIPGFEFAVYGGVQCSHVGLDEADMHAEVRRVFGLNEGKGIEAGLLGTRFVAQAASDDPTDRLTNVAWDDPEDVTVAGATGSFSLQTALAALEGYAATVYAGVPTIHMPRAAASMLSALGGLNWVNGLAYTKLGAKVACGGGYDDPTAFAAGDFTLYATGEVYVEKSETVDVSTFVVPGDGLNTETASGNDFGDNTQIALAERMFRVAVDCFVAKATVSLT